MAFKWQVLKIILFYWSESFCRIGFSIMLYALLQVLTDLQNNDILSAYLLALFSGVLWLFGQTFMHNGFYEVTILTTYLRSTLIGLLFKKMTRISQYMAKSQELGKIINMLSNDFNLFELKAPSFFAGMSTPIIVVGAIALLITRLGWVGIICPLVILLLIPLQLLIGRLNGVILEDINKYKDHRVKLCTEIIEGIKFIKLYGWEIAFREIIQSLRKS